MNNTNKRPLGDNKQHRSVGVMVAPNGARLTPDDHPAVPVTVPALVETIVGCAHEGACAAHLHTRDSQFKHVLDAEQYMQSINLIQQELGVDFPVQITTEAVGVFTQQDQIDLVMKVKPEFVSVALCEVSGVGQDLGKAGEFYFWCSENDVAVQHILYEPDEVAYFFELKSKKIIPENHHSLLFVLGKYTTNQQSDPAVLNEFLSILKIQENAASIVWTICAFGVQETECLVKAAEAGGHIRVGFENNVLNSDGSSAKNNEERVRLLSAELKNNQFELCSKADMRRILGAYQ